METTNQPQQQAQQPAIIDPIVKPTESKEFLLSAMGQEIKHFELIQRQALMYATSTIVPKEYRGNDKIGNIIIAMDMAKRLNANLLLIMQNLNVIQGHPAWSAKFLIATVNSCGRFDPIRYRFTEHGFIGKLTYNETVFDPKLGRNTYVSKEFDGSRIKNIECVAYTNRKGSNEIMESSPVDVKTAILEGWYTKNGSKWPVMTKQMLMYRAASWWTNVYAPDLSMGLMTVEEVEDTRTIVDAEFEEMKPTRHIGFGADEKPNPGQPETTNTEPFQQANTENETTAPNPQQPATNPDQLFT